MHKGQNKAIGRLKKKNKPKPICNLQILIIHKVKKYELFTRIYRLGKCLDILEIGEWFLFTLRLIPNALAT